MLFILVLTLLLNQHFCLRSALDQLDDETLKELDPKIEHEYECVICQAVPSPPKPMVLLVMMCESGCKCIQVPFNANSELYLYNALALRHNDVFTTGL